VGKKEKTNVLISFGVSGKKKWHGGTSIKTAYMHLVRVTGEKRVKKSIREGR